MTYEGWRTFSSVLRNGNSALEAFYLAETSLDDDAAGAIANSLVDNKMLKVLDLYYNEDISFHGWQNFFGILTLLQQDNTTSCTLEEINLSENNIDHDAAVAFLAAFSNNGKLKILRLDDNKSIKAPG